MALPDPIRMESRGGRRDDETSGTVAVQHIHTQLAASGSQPPWMNRFVILAVGFVLLAVMSVISTVIAMGVGELRYAIIDLRQDQAESAAKVEQRLQVIDMKLGLRPPEEDDPEKEHR